MPVNMALQAGKSTTQTGMGYGLSWVKEKIEFMDGKITITNKTNGMKGAKVILSFPKSNKTM